MRSDRDSFLAAIEAGATGYLIKDSPTDEFAKAVQQIRSGRRYIDPQLALNLAFANNAALSAGERRVLELLLEDVPVIRPSRH
jgi:two-component system response regulator DesR